MLISKRWPAMNNNTPQHARSVNTISDQPRAVYSSSKSFSHFSVLCIDNSVCNCPHAPFNADFRTWGYTVLYIEFEVKSKGIKFSDGYS